MQRIEAGIKIKPGPAAGINGLVPGQRKSEEEQERSEWSPEANAGG